MAQIGPRNGPNRGRKKVRELSRMGELLNTQQNVHFFPDREFPVTLGDIPGLGYPKYPRVIWYWKRPEIAVSAQNSTFDTFVYGGPFRPPKPRFPEIPDLGAPGASPGASLGPPLGPPLGGSDLGVDFGVDFGGRNRPSETAPK